MIELILLALFFGILFFIEDLYNKEVRINPSLIAGIGLSYFFLVVLPEVAAKIPEYPLHLRNFEYLFFLIGIGFMHISEKLILRKIEHKTRKRAQKLIQNEQNLEQVEKNISLLLAQEINATHVDQAALRELAQVLASLNRQEVQLRQEILKAKQIVQSHVSKDLHELRHFTKFIYHFLIGFILLNLLLLDIIEGALFFMFSFLFALISNVPHEKLYSDLDIEESKDDLKKRHYLVALSTILGVIFATISAILAPPNLESIYLAFSFISGVILYKIMREVVPPKEKGNIKLFILGGLGFATFIYIVEHFYHFS
jgi:hypothetical protein